MRREKRRRETRDVCVATYQQIDLSIIRLSISRALAISLEWKMNLLAPLVKRFIGHLSLSLFFLPRLPGLPRFLSLSSRLIFFAVFLASRLSLFLLLKKFLHNNQHTRHLLVDQAARWLQLAFSCSCAVGERSREATTLTFSSHSLRRQRVLLAASHHSFRERERKVRGKVWQWKTFPFFLSPQ